MRLLRLRLHAFERRRPIELRFGDPECAPDVAEPRVSFLVGANGTGKSRALEQLGLIFSHLAIGQRPGLAFELEYLLGHDRRVLVTTDKRTSISYGGRDAPAVAPGLWLVTFEGGKHQLHARWPARAAEWLPGRVVGYSTGPVSRLEWALTDSARASFDTRRTLLAAELPPPGMSAEEWERHREERLAALEEERQQALDTPVTTAVGASDSMLAAVALLAHPGTSSPLVAEGRRRILEHVRLHVREPLVAFSLDLPVNWEELVHGSSAAELETLLGHADRTVAIALDDGTEGVRAVFDCTPGLAGALRRQAATPLVWFEQMHRWWRRGALRDCHLVLAQGGRGPCLLDDELSDGEYLMLGRYALLLLVAEVDDLLVLLDEPETHFNDRWKVDLVRDVSALAATAGRVEDGTTADVVISTHSDLTLTDADHACVHVFRRVRNDGRPRLEVRPAPISPLAADRRDIVLDIFGLESGIGARAGELIERALISSDRERIEEVIRQLGPGFHRFRLQTHLAELERAE